MSNNLAYIYAAKLLAKADYSKKKLVHKLLQKKFNESDINIALALLIDKNFLNEKRYAENVTISLMHRYYSPQFIHQKLLVEDIDFSLVSISTIFDEYQVTTEKQIVALINKKIGKQNGLIDEKLEYKIITSIVSKGHDLERCKQILETNFSYKHHF